jgi:hypothetical protein
MSDSESEPPPKRTGPSLYDSDGNLIFVDQENVGPFEPSPPITFWYSLKLPGGGVHMQVADTDKGWAITGVYVHAPEITTTLLREIPLGQLILTLNLMNAPDAGPGFNDPFTVAEVFNEGFGQQVLIDPMHEPRLATLRKRAENAPEEFPTPREESRPRLTRPDGSDPDAFYALVGAAYREYALQTRAPAVEIANEAGIPVATARSWVREARRRGKLPTGTRGKAG